MIHHSTINIKKKPRQVEKNILEGPKNILENINNYSTLALVFLERFNWNYWRQRTLRK